MRCMKASAGHAGLLKEAGDLEELARMLSMSIVGTYLSLLSHEHVSLSKLVREACWSHQGLYFFAIASSNAFKYDTISLVWVALLVIEEVCGYCGWLFVGLLIHEVMRWDARGLCMLDVEEGFEDWVGPGPWAASMVASKEVKFVIADVFEEDGDEVGGRGGKLLASAWVQQPKRWKGPSKGDVLGGRSIAGSSRAWILGHDCRKICYYAKTPQVGMLSQVIFLDLGVRCEKGTRIWKIWFSWEQKSESLRREQRHSYKSCTQRRETKHFVRLTIQRAKRIGRATV